MARRQLQIDRLRTVFVLKCLLLTRKTSLAYVHVCVGLHACAVNSRALHLLPNILVNAELQLFFLGLGAMPALVRLCKHENTTLVYRNLVVLLILAQAQENLAKMKALAVVLVEPLINVCRDHFTTPTIDRATDLLLKLVRDDEAQKQLFVNLKVVELLIKIIAHCQQPAAKENAVIMIQQLYHIPIVRKSILYSGGLGPLLRIRNHGETESMRRICAIFVAEMSLAQGMSVCARVCGLD